MGTQRYDLSTGERSHLLLAKTTPKKDELSAN